MTKLDAARPLLVYVHVPFCLSKCHFCDWVTEIPVADLRQRAEDPRRIAYIEALCTQIRAHGAVANEANYRPSIMYWGGGTATILNEREIAAIGDALHDTFDLSELKEATIEGSPDTLTKTKLKTFQDVGFTRVSLGVQSLSEPRLRALGRTHTVEGAVHGVELARESGFEDISIDLMCGLPGEVPDEFMGSLERALELPINHVALYPYRAAAGTTLVRQLRVGRGGALRLDEQQSVYRMGSERLRNAGFEEYAASHFGTPPCHSDMAYFKLEMDWLGFGSGSTSVLEGEYRAFKRGYLDQYLEDPTTFDEIIPAASAGIATRLVYQALTTHEGVVRELFEERMQKPLEDVLALPAVKGLLNTVHGITGIEQDDLGVRIPAERIAHAFIHLLFMNAPQMSRELSGPQACLGHH